MSPGRDSTSGADRPAPFLAEPTVPVTSAARFDWLADRVHLWRRWLGVGLAAVITAAVAGAYWAFAGTAVETATRRTAVPAVLAPATSAAPAPEADQAATLPDRDQGSAAGPAGNVVDLVTSSTQPPSARLSTTSLPGTTIPTSTAVPATTPSDDVTTTVVGVRSSPPPGETTTSSAESPTTSSEPGASTTTSDRIAPTAAVSTTTTETTGSSTPQPVRVEAESGEVHGTAASRDDHAGFSGTGFVGDILTEGSGVTLLIESEKGGLTAFTVRYAAGQDNGPADGRSLTVFVNDERVTRAEMRVTASWSEWDVVVGELPLLPGTNKISLLWADGDTGWVNLDYIQIN